MGAQVTTYRKMRRQARQAHRSGLQPMMVINSGDQFPDPVGSLLAHLAWRYRSELVPLAVAFLMFGLGWCAHAALFHR